MKIIIDDFLNAAKLADTEISNSDIYIQDLGCPHNPTGLPNGKMAIYTFQIKVFCPDKRLFSFSSEEEPNQQTPEHLHILFVNQLKTNPHSKTAYPLLF